MTERYATPDAGLTLLVQRDDDDITIGFEGFPWHTHADIIADLRRQKDPESALQVYLDDLFHDRLPIVLVKKAGVLTEPFIPDFPSEPIDTSHSQPEETYEVRFWSGTQSV
ncbi:MAG: hypothetical protein ACR2NX_08205 [Chthoniobacterales bacterium]